MFVFGNTTNIGSKTAWITISVSSNALFCFVLLCVFRRTFLKCKSFYDHRVAHSSFSCFCCVSVLLIPLNHCFLFHSKWKLTSTSNYEPYPLDFIERDLTSVKGVIKEAITISQTVSLSIPTCLQSIINLNCLILLKKIIYFFKWNSCEFQTKTFCFFGHKSKMWRHFRKDDWFGNNLSMVYKNRSTARQ